MSVGASWTPEPIKKGRNELWCSECRRFVPWKEADPYYECQGSDVHRLWVHIPYGNVCRDDNMDDLRMVLERKARMQKYNIMIATKTIEAESPDEAFTQYRDMVENQEVVVIVEEDDAGGVDGIYEYPVRIEVTQW